MNIPTIFVSHHFSRISRQPRTTEALGTLFRSAEVVRGASWFDRPIHAGSASRLSYRPWQAVNNVSFRVVRSAEGQPTIVSDAGQPPVATSAR